MSSSPRLIYIHGFNSSPESFKAKKLGEWLVEHKCAIEYRVPKLSPYPQEAIQQLQMLLDHYQNHDYTYLVGSSLGGYFASYLAERYACKAVLINPSVTPSCSLKNWLGENTNFHTGETYLLEEKHADELLALNVKAFTYPQKIWVLLQTGDETLDFKAASAKYFNSPCAIEYGGDHSFQQFEQWIPRIINFFQKKTTAVY